MRTSWAFMLCLAFFGVAYPIFGHFNHMTTVEKTTAFIGLVLVLAIGGETLYQGLRRDSAQKKKRQKRHEVKQQRTNLP